MRTRTHYGTYSVSLVSMVQFRCVTPIFASTESQEFKSDITVGFFFFLFFNDDLGKTQLSEKTLTFKTYKNTLIL